MAPTSTDTPQSGWTRTRYPNGSGQVLVEAVSMANTPHNLPVQYGAAALAAGTLTLGLGLVWPLRQGRGSDNMR